jgi:ribonuclease HII
MPDLSLEQELPRPVAGVDEVGRGSLVGPVVAAAVILTPAFLSSPERSLLDDSKKMPPIRREKVARAVMELCLFGIGRVEADEIDRDGILPSTMKAMDAAVRGLDTKPSFILVDGDRLPSGLPCLSRAVVRGDSLSLSIAAASVVAKVYRDRLLVASAVAHPGYGWERNSGYGTPAHKEALRRLGPSPLHRRSFVETFLADHGEAA